MKSAQNDYFVGMRFRIRFEGEESAEKRQVCAIRGYFISCFGFMLTNY